MRKTLPIINAFVGLIFPDLCQVCHRESRISDSPFCVKCLSELPFTGLEKGEENEFTNHFKGMEYPTHGMAIFHLNPGSGIAQMIHEIKYHQNPGLARLLGRFIGEVLKPEMIHLAFDCIVPVPLHPKKKKIRGYNQSEEIAKGIALVLDLPLDSGSLTRNRFTTTQTRLNRLQRIQNTRNAFHYDPFRTTEDYRHLLLVDDVLTTGSTLQACAESILRKGKRKISMLTIALGD